MEAETIEIQGVPEDLRPIIRALMSHIFNLHQKVLCHHLVLLQHGVTGAELDAAYEQFAPLTAAAQAHLDKFMRGDGELTAEQLLEGFDGPKN